MQLHLASHKRKTELYLRALWNSEFLIDRTEGSQDASSPLSYLENFEIFLPAEINASHEYAEYYRAAATHAAAHAMYGSEPVSAQGINFMQRKVIGLVEDLRVELLAIREFPGLRKLWLTFHNQPDKNQISALQLMLRLSRSVLDPGYHDSHQWVIKGRQLILESEAGFKKKGFSREAGMKLANDLGQMRLPLNSGQYQQEVSYRDDNRCLWQETIEYRETSSSAIEDEQLQLQNSQIVERAGGKKLKFSHLLSKNSEGFYIRESEQADFLFDKQQEQFYSDPLYYPEWDYRIDVLKKQWCTLYKQECETGSGKKIEAILNKHKPVLSRLQHIASKLRIEKLQRIRKVDEGEEIDLDPMINSLVSLRSNHTPDTRVFMRTDRVMDKSLAISVLLDLSESTNEKVRGTDITLTEMLRDAVVLLGETLSVSGERFAISGFSSNGRNEVYVKNFKTFDREFEKTRSGLSEISGRYSTRLGPAIRHVASQLAIQPERKKLLLVITDGAPSDIDVYDQEYLAKDSWHAVRSLSRMGIKPFCINLDSKSDACMESIFGKGRFQTLSSLARLPELLSYVYIKYMRS